MNRCEQCKTFEAKIRLQTESNTMYLCNDCYNELMAEELEVDLEQLAKTFSVKDYEGVNRTFNVERSLQPNGLFLEATENIESGYKFAVHGELSSNQQELHKQLIEKTRKGTAKQNIKTSVLPSGHAHSSIVHYELTGLIEYDETSSGTPLVIIDGKPFTWEEVGKMLMTYEGFQFKLKMYDATEDVE